MYNFIACNLIIDVAQCNCLITNQLGDKMKTLLYILLFAASTAQAVDFEASIGRTTYTKSENGIYYQNGFYNDFSIQATSYSIGITDYATDNVRWHLGYTNLGKVESYAIAVQDDLYNGVNGCYAPCAPMFQFKGYGSLEGIYLTIAPEIKISDVKLFVEVGAWGYIPDFHMKMYYPITNKLHSGHTTDTHMQFGPVLGMGIEYERFQIVATVYSAQIGGIDSETITFWNDYVTNISIRKAF